MKTFASVCVILCLVPAFYAAPKLTCIRSLKCTVAHQGCYVVDGLCRCDQALCCNNPFNYSTLESCLADNALQLEDPCKDDPCKNNGYCVQLMGQYSYRCDCYGTGYFGPHCHKKCPKDARKEIYSLKGKTEEHARNRKRYLMACL